MTRLACHPIVLGLILVSAALLRADEPGRGARPVVSPPPGIVKTPAGREEPAIPEPTPEQRALQRLEQARAVASQRLAGLRNAGWLIRAPRDSSSGSERVLWLVPGGPLVVQLNATIDGAPYWKYNESLLDEMLAAAPADWYGTKWEEMLKKSRIARGPYAYVAQNPQMVASIVQQYDGDADGRVTRMEARAYLAQAFGGTPFMLMAMPNRMPSPPVSELLDADRDGILSESEIEAAAQRLQSRDANDDEFVEQFEFGGGGGALYGVPVQVKVAASTPPSYNGAALLMLDPDADVGRLHQALVQRYGADGKLTKKNLPLVPALFAKLDADKDGELSADETKKLLDVEPQLKLNLRLGQTGDQPAGLTVERAEIEPGTTLIAATAGDIATLELGGVRLQLAGGNPPVAINYDGQVAQVFNFVDADKNGYLEKKEVEKQPGYLQQFDMWDHDGDGKVYPDEVKKSYERMQAPQMNRISVATSELGNSMFGTLDANSDGRLSRRELAAAAKRLKALDKNRDGKLEPHEIPVTVRLAANRSNYVYQYLQPQQFAGYRPPGTPAPKAAGPEWFQRMDRNGDGDLSPREFLGDAEQFRALDADADGLISADEAEKK